MISPQESHVDEVFGDDQAPRHSFLPERKIEGWHRPRKQWLRKNQWLKEIDNLCDKIIFKDARPLRYLTLPGIDLLDIRLLRGSCQNRNMGLKYLGLNDKNSSNDTNTWLNIACNEVNAFENVHRDSIVIRDRFELIADKKSQANRYVSTYGPFDVVNLDLCSSLSPIRSGNPNYYDALRELTTYQIRTRPSNEPWLLLITSRAGSSSVNNSDMARLAQCINNNILEHHKFAELLEELIPNATRMCSGEEINWSQVDKTEFLNLFSIGFGKWLLQLLAGAQPKWSVRLLSSYAYSVEGTSPDMVSLAFILESHTKDPTDNSGLSSTAKQSPPTYDEKGLAMEMIEGVRTMQNLDLLLNEANSDYEIAKSETIELLKNIGYSETAIVDGLSGFEGVSVGQN